MERLEPGYYVLTADIDNPRRDKRATWGLPGVTAFKRGVTASVGETWVTFHRTGANGVVETGWGDERMLPVFALLEPKPVTTFDDWRKHEGDVHGLNWSTEILGYLVDNGRLSIQDLRDAKHEIEAEDCDEP